MNGRGSAAIAASFAISAILSAGSATADIASIASDLFAASRDMTAGRLQRGNRVLLSGFGAGLSWGTGIMQW